MQSETPEWALKGRDGEPVTLLQKLEQVMEFASAMERLAIENNTTASTLRTALTEAQAALTPVRDELMTAAYTHDDEAPPWGNSWTQWDDYDRMRDWLEAQGDAITKTLPALHSPTGAGTTEAN